MATKQDFLSHFDLMVKTVADSCPFNSSQRIAARYRLIGAVDLMYLSGVLSMPEADQLMARIYQEFPLTYSDLDSLFKREAV